MMRRKIGKFAANAVGVVAVVAVVVVLAVVVVIPRAVGGTSLTVLSGSMSPAIPQGSIVVVKPVDPQTLEVGDVITWQVRPGEATYITHRIVEVNDAERLSFVTQGDANSTPDLVPVTAGAVRGQVIVDLPFAGRAVDAMKSGAGVTLLIAVGVLAIVVGVVRSLLAGRRERSDSHREPPRDDTFTSGSDEADIIGGTMILVHSNARDRELRILLDLVDLLQGRVVGQTAGGVSAVIVGESARLKGACELLESFTATSVSSATIDLRDATSDPDTFLAPHARPSTTSDQSEWTWVLVALTVSADITRHRDLAVGLRLAGAIVTRLTPSSWTALVGCPARDVGDLADSVRGFQVAASFQSDGVSWPETPNVVYSSGDFLEIEPEMAIAAPVNGVVHHGA